MKKEIQRKKLSLSKETLKNVAGGASSPTAACVTAESQADPACQHTVDGCTIPPTTGTAS